MKYSWKTYLLSPFFPIQIQSPQSIGGEADTRLAETLLPTKRICMNSHTKQAQFYQADASCQQGAHGVGDVLRILNLLKVDGALVG